MKTVARGVRRWQWRVERRRLLALIRRAALVGITTACLLQVGELATGHSGLGVWLVPAAMVAAIVLAIGLTQPTSAAVAARLLDRDLYLGAKVSTALELERSPRAANAHGLGALALADGRGALAASLAGARACLRPRHGERALLVALAAGLVVLLSVPSPRSQATRTAAAAKARAAPPSSRALRADNGLAASAGPGPSLQGFKQAPLDSPPLAAVQAGGTTRAGGAASGRSPYGGGTANTTTGSSTAPASRTLGQSGSVKGSEDPAGSGSSGSRQGSGSLPTGASGEGKKDVPGGSSGSKGGPGRTSVAPVPHGQPSASAPGGDSSGTASRTGGKSAGGSGSSAPGSASGGKGRKPVPGGATAGTTRGGKNRGKGVIPQLGGKSALPITPGYESVPGTKGATEESASASAGRGGGAGHSGQAIGAAGAGGGAGVPYVPPGSAVVASIDRSVVLGYFASFDRVNASGW